MKHHLAGVRFDTVYSSPLRRAWDTARIVAGELPVIPDERLAEIHHGSWQGRTKTNIASRWPGEWERWNKEPLRFTPPDGEPAACVRARVEDFLGTLQGTNILCVSHGVVIQTFLSVLAGGSFLEHTHAPANGSIHTFVL